MLNVVKPHRDVDPIVLSKAIEVALACCAATEYDRRGDAKGAPKIGAFPNYFGKVLATKIDDVRLSALRLETEAAVITEVAKLKVKTEEQAATRKLEALNTSIEVNAAPPRTRCARNENGLHRSKFGLPA